MPVMVRKTTFGIDSTRFGGINATLDCTSYNSRYKGNDLLPKIINVKNLQILTPANVEILSVCGAPKRKEYLSL